MDRWLLAGMATLEEVGVFSVAHRFASIILFVSMAFGQAWSPLAMKIRTDHPQTYKILYVDILITLSCAMLLIGGGIALFASDIVAWLMPAEYHGSGVVLAALALGLVMQSTMQVTALGISIEKKTYLFGRLAWVAAALNLILNLVLIPSLGALGAAIASSLCYLFLTLAYLYYTQRLHPLPLPRGKIAVFSVMWLMLAGCLITQQIGDPMANSMAWRGSLLFVILLVCGTLIPWRRSVHV
jgi:O-antigen/teichoic acid export membrane protein